MTVATFEGSAVALKYAKRDLPNLAQATNLTTARTAAVQAGGNLGVWAAWLADRFATVYCFEPAADLFPVLVKNAPAENIVKFQAALGERPGLVGLSRHRTDGKYEHEGVTHVSGTGVIPTMRLDDLGLPACDLLSLDLEGYELFALRGAAQTIARCRPVILIEINNNSQRYDCAPEVTRGWLMDAGYWFVTREYSDEIWMPKERV